MAAYDPRLLRKAASYVEKLADLSAAYGVALAVHEGHVTFDLEGVTFHVVTLPERAGLALGFDQ